MVFVDFIVLFSKLNLTDRIKIAALLVYARKIWHHLFCFYTDVSHVNCLGKN